AWVGALYPPLVHFSSQVLSENVSVPLLLAAVWLTLVVLDRPAWRPAVLCGAAWGLAVLARPAALPALVVGVIVLVARRQWRRWLPAAALVTLTTAVVVTPWLVRDAHAVGGPVPVVSNESFTLWVSNRRDTNKLKD